MVAWQREISDRCLGWQPRRPIEGGRCPPTGRPGPPHSWGVIGYLGGRGAAFKITNPITQLIKGDTAWHARHMQREEAHADPARRRHAGPRVARLSTLPAACQTASRSAHYATPSRQATHLTANWPNESPPQHRATPCAHRDFFTVSEHLLPPENVPVGRPGPPLGWGAIAFRRVEVRAS